MCLCMSKRIYGRFELLKVRSEERKREGERERERGKAALPAGSCGFFTRSCFLSLIFRTIEWSVGL